jgi:hypothetical protein
VTDPLHNATLRTTGALPPQPGLETRTVAAIRATGSLDVRTTGALDPRATGTVDVRPIEVQEAPVNAQVEERAQEICSRLLIDRWLNKRSYRDLLVDDDLRAAVARRLAGVGLELVESFTSDYFAVRLQRRIEADIAFDWATNSRMPRGAVALLVVLWAKLVLPKRIAASEEAIARQARLAGSAPEAGAKVEVAGLITVSRDALYAEFGRKFGKTAFARYLGHLKQAGFIREDRQRNLREGPLLDLLIDGVQMAQKLRDSVLWDMIERGDGVPASQEAASDDDGEAEELAILDLDEPDVTNPGA